MCPDRWFFLDSKLTPLFIVASLLVGFLAVMVIPREEEPQIIVPMLDVTTSMPGASPEEVEQRVTTPLESILHEISGVEFVYSTSSPGRSLVIVRFLVGTGEEDALIKVYSKLYANGDKLPATASQPIVKLRSIDNVPILSLTMWGAHYSSAQLRSLAAAFQSSIQQVPEVSETQLIGGQPRALRVLPQRSKTRGVLPSQRSRWSAEYVLRMHRSKQVSSLLETRRFASMPASSSTVRMTWTGLPLASPTAVLSISET